LRDGLYDDTIRTNLFIAAYTCPDLLSQKEWVKCFDVALPKLWLRWGGLATIDKTDELFQEEHTGESAESYHNGDSWFWINNLAAIVLARVDKKRYKMYINTVLQASTKEILKSGALGHHAELSSAKELGSKGCVAQAWSAAMYVELVDELFSK